MKNKKGFTLVELLVVMVIFIIIVGLSYPAIKVLQSKSLDKKFNTYKDSMSLGAKLYKDSYDEDMFGRNENGCTCVKFEELKNKTLIKDISLNDVTCNTENTFVRVTKVDDNYTYTSFLGCKNKGSSDIDYIYPKAQEVHTFDSEGCNTLCNPEKSNGLYVYADPGKDTRYTKTKTIRLHVQSITGINQGIDISYSWSISNTGSEELTNYKKLRLSAPDDQKKKIAAGQIIEVDPPKIKTPAKSSGSYYLHVRVDNLTDLYGASWSQGDGGKYLIFGPYNIDNEPPLITKANIIPTDSNHNLPKPNLTVKAIDNITETENLRNCVSITKDSKFHHQLYTGTNKNILINSNNGCLEKYVNNSTYISNYYKKFIGEVNLSLMDEFGEKYPAYLSVIDEAGNHAYKELNYQTANKYTLEYDSNGGSKCNPAKKEVIINVSGDTTWGTLCAPTKTNDKFKGWFDDEDKEITKNTKVTKSLKVRAKWYGNKEINYHLNDNDMTNWKYIFGYKYMYSMPTSQNYTTFTNPSIYNEHITHKVDSLSKKKTDNITFKNVSYNSTPKNGIVLNGKDQHYMELGSLNSLEKVTAEVTFMLDDTNGGPLISNGQGGGFGLTIDDSNNYIHFTVGVRNGTWNEDEQQWDVDPYERLNYKYKFETNKKYHVVATFNGRLMSLYINGALVTSKDLIDTGEISGVVKLHHPTNGATGKIGAEPSINGTAHEPFLKCKIYSARIYDIDLDATQVEGNFKKENIRYNIIGNPANEKYYLKLSTQKDRNYTFTYKYKNSKVVDLKDKGKGIKIIALASVSPTYVIPTSDDISSSDIIKSQTLETKAHSNFITDSLSFTATSATTYIVFDFSDTDVNASTFKTSFSSFKISSSYTAGKQLKTPLLVHRRKGSLVGWNKEKTGSGNYVDNYTIINDDLDLYAIWTSHKCTVNYDPNGGKFTNHLDDTSQVFKDGSSGVSNLRDATEDYYASVWDHHMPVPGQEWKRATTKLDQTQGYSVIDFCPNIATKDETVTLQVNWATNYVLTLDHQGATEVNSLNTYYTLDNQLHSNSTCTSLVSKIAVPKKKIFNDLYDVNYVFKGYYTETEGKGMQIINENGYPVSANIGKITNDCKLYAYWAKIGWEFVNKSTLIDYGNHLTEQQWMYWKGDGSYYTGWLKICNANYDCGNNTSWWYFDLGTGYMKLGWFKVGSTWYYADPSDSGGSERNGYVDGTLAMNTIRWFNSGTSNAYCSHFDGNGACFSGTVSYNGKSYYCKANECPFK